MTTSEPRHDDLVASMEEILLTLHVVRDHTDSVISAISRPLKDDADNTEALLHACRTAHYLLQRMGFFGRSDHPSTYEQLVIALHELLTP